MKLKKSSPFKKSLIIDFKYNLCYNNDIRLREEKKLHVEPCVISREEVEFAPKYTYWSFGIMSIEGGYFIYQEYHKFNDDIFDSYEDAALAGIEYVLDNLI
jgi:hypothetical protein